MRTLFVVDSLSALELSGDTSYALMLEAAERGHEVWSCQPEHLSLEHEDAVADAQETAVFAAETPAEAFRCGERTPIPVDAFDAVWIRQDPPVDVGYLHTTWILERARGKTVFVNDPRGLRELNEHLSILDFPDLIPPTIVTRSQRRLRAFLSEQGGTIIVKPVDGFGGHGIFQARASDPNLSSILETATGGGAVWTMAQRYLPEAAQGDKRIVLVDGEPIGAVLRVPPEHEVRGNLHVGARPVRSEVSEEDMVIVRAVQPMLRAHGMLLVGLDIIGGRLTEINVTSPTGIRHISRLEDRNAASPVLECVEEKAAALRKDGGP